MEICLNLYIISTFSFLLCLPSQEDGSQGDKSKIVIPLKCQDKMLAANAKKNCKEVDEEIKAKQDDEKKTQNDSSRIHLHDCSWLSSIPS